MPQLSFHRPLPGGPALRPTIALALLTLSIGLLVGFGLGRWTPPADSTPPIETAAALPTAAPDEFALLTEIEGIVRSEYLRPDNAEQQTLVYGAARGMVGSLNDPNSVYETPREREEGDSRWTGRYDGVGMFVDQRNGETVVTAPVEGGPAARAGILPGDVILEVDGRPVSRLSLSDQTRLIRGPRGTTVTLTVRREGQLAPAAIPVVRDEVRLISARGRMLDSGLGVLRISQFTEATASETRTALDAILAGHPSGLLLDLRGNGGGLLEPAVQVAGYFLGGGPIVLEQHADGGEKTYTAPDGPVLTELPMLVLVDRGSASASEVMAAALRDRGRAELVGERTYGKNTVQYIHRLSDGSGLRLTVAEWHVPSGQPIPATGLEPDLPVPTPNPPLPNSDPVLEAATRALLSRITTVVGQPAGQ